jgi:hypothetical protein
MAADYRYWCGECHHRTSWRTEAEGAGEQVRHYARSHPGIPAGGRVEVRDKTGGGGGCLAVVGVLLLLVVLAPSCRHQAESQSRWGSSPVVTALAHATCDVVFCVSAQWSGGTPRGRDDMADEQGSAQPKASEWIGILTGLITILAFLGFANWSELEAWLQSDGTGASRVTAISTIGTSSGFPPLDYTTEHPTPIVDPTRRAFEKISPGDCLNAYMDPYQSLEWSQDVPVVVDCDRTDAYLLVTRVENSADDCRADALDGETWWRYPGAGAAIYLCLERQLRVGECVLGKKNDQDTISINGHGLMTSWGCGKDTVPKDFDYILRITALTNRVCPADSSSWDFRGGQLCARVA